MTKADLLILQDAAEEFSLESAENLGVNKSVCLQTAALAILCRVVADMIERETCGPDPLLVENKNVADASFALKAAEDRGWNNALSYAQVRLMEEGMPQAAEVVASLHGRALRSLGGE